MFTTLLAYIMIGFYFLIDGYARQGHQAKSLDRGQYDRGSTFLLSVAFFVSVMALLAAPFLNHLNVGYLTHWVGAAWIGIVIMGISLLMRLWANMALGALYTRTLRVVEGHHIVHEGPYSVIRHPGYLGVILMWIGGSLAVMNWIAVLAVLVSMSTAYHYRINAEETMLAMTQGKEYDSYRAHTWRLIPFIY